MPTNRSAVAALERQLVRARPATVAELNDQLAAPIGPGLVHGPITIAPGLPISPDEPIYVAPGRKAVVTLAGELREILPPGVYQGVSWSGQLGVELQVVDTRQRKLLIQTSQELNLRYPLTASSDFLQPFDLDVAVTYRVVDVQQVALVSAEPLLDLFDAALDVLRDLLDGQPVEACLTQVRRLPGEMRQYAELVELGFEVLAAHLTSRPAPANLHPVVAARREEEPLIERLQRELAPLAEQNIPSFVHETAQAYLVHIPLFDTQGHQLSIHLVCQRDYPRTAPQVLVELDGVERRGYAPKMLSQWGPDQTLATMVNAVMNDHL